MPTKPAATSETLSPARNFTLETSARVGALTAGPPAYMRRLRAIEELELSIVRSLAEKLGEAAAAGRGDVHGVAQAGAPARALARLADLYRSHNRFYPVEANLPIDLRTGELLDRTGARWRPSRPPALEELVSRAEAALAVCLASPRG